MLIPVPGTHTQVRLQARLPPLAVFSGGGAGFRDSADAVLDRRWPGILRPVRRRRVLCGLGPADLRPGCRTETSCSCTRRASCWCWHRLPCPAASVVLKRYRPPEGVPRPPADREHRQGPGHRDDPARHGPYPAVSVARSSPPFPGRRPSRISGYRLPDPCPPGSMNQPAHIQRARPCIVSAYDQPPRAGLASRPAGACLRSPGMRRRRE